jgi:Fe-S cluster assembly protein SufD
VNLHPTPLVDPKTALIRNDYAANAADLPGAGLGWLDARREAAIDTFARTGMPTRRVEEWKYTDLAAVLEDSLEPLTPFRAEMGELADTSPFSSAGTTQITLVDGYLYMIGGATLPDSVDIVDLSQLSVRTPEWVGKELGRRAVSDQVLGAASLALMRGGVAIKIRAGATGLPQLQLNFVNSSRSRGGMSHSRVLLIVEEEAELDLIETHHGGDNPVLSNIGMEIVLGANAVLTHARIQEDSKGAVNVTTIGADLASDARYGVFLANLGARLSRTDMNVKLSAPGAEASVRSITALDGEAHADVTTVIDHAAPHTASRQLFKSVLGGRARSVSQGKVVVREGAVKSDSHQLFKALLLGPRAEADAKPELEIFADDVQCGHGTAIGALDANALFYLRSRGIPEAEAKGLLVRAFLGEVVESVANEVFREVLWEQIDGVLEKIAGGVE